MWKVGMHYMIPPPCIAGAWETSDTKDGPKDKS